MVDHPDSLLLLVVLLPLAAGVTQRLLAPVLGREGRWITPLAALLACACGLALLGDSLAGPATVGDPLRLLEPSPHAVHTRLDGTLVRLDADRDGSLSRDELGRDPGAADRNQDGRLSVTELAAFQAQAVDGWVSLGVGAPNARGDLRLGLRLRNDRLGATLLVILTLVAAAAGWRLAAAAPGAGPASPTPPALVALALSCFLASACADGVAAGLTLWFAGALAVWVLQHADSLNGAPNPLGIGTFLLASSAAVACLAALTLAPGDSWESLQHPSLPLALTLVVGLGIPSLILPLRTASLRQWGPSLALYAGAVVPAAIVLLLRAKAAFGAPVLDALSVAAAVLVGVATLRVARAETMNRTLTWAFAASVGCALLAFAHAPTPSAAGLVFLQGLALAGSILAADSVREHSGRWSLQAQGGLRDRPVLGIGLALCALALAGLPPLGGFAVLRDALVGVAANAGAPWLVVPVLWLGLLAVALGPLRVLLAACRGRGDAHPAPGGAAALAPLTAGLITALGSKPLLGLGPFEDALAWGPTLDSSTQASLAVAALAAIAGVVAWDDTTRPERPRVRHPRFAWLDAYSPQRRVVQPLLRLARSWRASDERLFEGIPTRAALRVWPRAGRPAPGADDTPRAPDAEPTRGAWADGVALLLVTGLVWALVQGLL